MSPPPVAVTGLGVASALGTGVAEFAASLRDGVSAVRARENADDTTPVWAPLPELDPVAACAALAVDDDTHERVRAVVGQACAATAAAVVCAVQAAADARLHEFDPQRVGVVVSGSNLTNRQQRDATLRQEAGRRVLPRHAVQLFDSDVAASITEALGTSGEAWTAGAASASGGVGLALARRAVLSGDVDAALVVGVPMLLTEADLAALGSLGALFRGDPDRPQRACRPFDRSAAGFVYGESAAAVLVEDVDVAQRRGAYVHGLLRGAAIRSGASRSPAPDADVEAAVMTDALGSAGLAATDVGLINAHATASAPGDAAEARALHEVFGGHRPLVNATKAMSGHCLGAAGVLEAVGSFVQMAAAWAHPNPNLDDPIDTDLRLVGATTEPWDGRCAISNSFGFGGLHTSLVLTRD